MEEKATCQVTFVREKVTVEVPQGENLRKTALRAGVQVYEGLTRFLNCMGHGTCGTCLVVVREGMENLSPKTIFEKLNFKWSLTVLGNEDKARLSCQTQIRGDCKIETNRFNWTGENFWQKPYPNK